MRVFYICGPTHGTSICNTCPEINYMELMEGSGAGKKKLIWGMIMISTSLS